uniref:Uncharacterized protein n=1 Tax=Graphocephala atropunctata TaxID=36148 RepID=A0A1B6KFU7_9HEMI
MTVVFKCKKCRTILLNYPEITLLSAHGWEMVLKQSASVSKIEFIDTKSEGTRCSSFDQDVFYISEVNMPQWITYCIDKGEWTRGKLMCPGSGCSARVGSFDFVSGFHCGCQSSVVPPVHLVRSKIDYSSSTNVL